MGTQAQTTPPVVRALVNQTALQPGAVLQVGASVTNPGGGPLADFYVGIQLPDGINAVVVRLGAAPVAASLANLAALPSTAAGVNLASAFSVNEPALLSYTFTGVEPPGPYTTFVAAVVAGGLRDGALGPGELLAFSTTSFTFGVGGTMLTGAPSSPALDVTTNFIGADRVPPSAVSTDVSGRRIARTQLEVAFETGATVGQVNAAIGAVSGRIVSMLRGVLILLIEVPDPGSLIALEAVRARLAGQPAVRFVELAQFPTTSSLPPQFSAASADLPKIDHLIATRTPAAWNTVEALTGATRPLMLVGDYFGGGAPGATFDATVTTADYATSPLEKHGYHVLGTIVGTFAGDTSAAGLVTGLLPGTSPVRSVDGSSISWAALDNRLIQIVAAHSGNVVVNTSLQSACASAAEVAAKCATAPQQAEAVGWLEKVRGTANIGTAGAGLERKFLHAAAAGNVAVTGDLNAATSGPYASATLLSGKTSGVTQVPDAENTLVVENLVNEAGSPFRPDCLSVGSKRVLTRNALTDLVNVSAPGTDIWSMFDASASAGDLGGTSMATPQVAALAGWVWALRPALSPRQVMLVITKTARRHPILNLDTRCRVSSAPAPTIDTYAAVLGTDVGLTDAPVRLALFDVGGPAGPQAPDGFFDDADLAQFAQAVSLAGGALDYSRFDLNGDGHTGGATQAPFDLDFDLTYQTATRTVGGVTRTVDESLATDTDVLCHYAYSSIYTGDVAERSRLIGATCGEGPFSVTDASLMAGNVNSDLSTDRFQALQPNVAIPDLTLADPGGSASITGVTWSETVTENTATSFAVNGSQRARFAAAGATRASGTMSWRVNVQMPPGRGGTATFSASIGGVVPGSIAAPGLSTTRSGTVTVALQPGERYGFSAVVFPSFSGLGNSSWTVSVTYALRVVVTP
ncbi:MAG: S8 family serine peptidase [Acidobacteria bacterium]|nr:S8 family serine peptidase [Acidobacteriota bacterium]